MIGVRRDSWYVHVGILLTNVTFEKQIFHHKTQNILQDLFGYLLYFMRQYTL